MYSPSWYRAPLRLQSAADIDGSASSASVYATIASANFLALKRSLPRDLAAAAAAESTGFFVSGFSAAPSSSSSDSPSSSTMATRFIPLRSTLSVTIRRAFAQSRRTSVFVGSMSSAAVRSSNAAASSPATPVSSLAAPRRMSALKNLGSRSSARSQSAMASCHRACFISAAALLLCTAGESGSSLSERVYASMADRNSLALNSSLPFSFSRMATHFFSFSEAPRMAWSVRWTSTLAPGTERSSSLASAGRVRLPMPPSIASAFAISSGDGIRPALSSVSSSFDAVGADRVSSTEMCEAPRMGAPLAPAPMNVGSCSSRAFASSETSVHIFRSLRKSSASASDLARVAGSSGKALAPSAVILALTTADVCGNPSSLRVLVIWRAGARSVLVCSVEE